MKGDGVGGPHEPERNSAMLSGAPDFFVLATLPVSVLVIGGIDRSDQLATMRPG